MSAEIKPVTILGAGLAGSLMTILLARRGIPVNLIERRPDLRAHARDSGRSINLALADRGLHALKLAGLESAIQPLLIPMTGRMLHDIDGNTHLVSYGQQPHEVIYSVSRNALTQLLLQHAGQHAHVNMQFEIECVDVNLAQQQLLFGQFNDTSLAPYEQLIAADGYHSVIRKELLSATQSLATDDLLPHGYKELTMPAAATGKHHMHANALHIWPRGGFMLIALPNIDGTFTVTLFLPFESDASSLPCFSSLKDATAINQFFKAHFPDALTLMPDVAEEFLTHPTGKMHTIRAPRWTDGRSAILIGDAAHAIVPFHGQGMNCAFEDCIALDRLMAHSPFAEAIRAFEQQRKPNADAIADMALENYIEMRDIVRQPKFLLQKELSFELERRFPDRFIPRYSMVMFHYDIPYAVAYDRGKIQAQILDELTQHASTIDDVDMSSAAKKINELLTPFA
jgi:kynurenine 3-monooxygenase